MNVSRLIAELQDLARLRPDAEVMFRDEEGSEFALGSAGVTKGRIVLRSYSPVHTDCAAEVREDVRDLKEDLKLTRESLQDARSELKDLCSDSSPREMVPA